MKFIFTFFAICFSQFVLSNGVVITNQVTGEYLRQTNSEITVNVQNQIGTIITSQIFINDSGQDQEIIYAFPMPSDASIIDLRWRVDNGEWSYAQFSANDPTGGGTGSGSNPILDNYLGLTPFFFGFEGGLAADSIIEIELSYVELLPYSFNEVFFNYPSDYSAIQPSVIEGVQRFNFNLFSERTIEEINLTNNTGTITNDGNTATILIEVFEGNSIEDITVVYELNSEELGVIAFSTLLEEGTNTCDELGDGFFGLVVEPESNASTEVIDKNFVLIIDKSGSMSGNKIVQAKEAASFIVSNLNFGDFFNLVDFNNDVFSFSDNLVEYSNESEADALNYIDNIQAGGGTNISESLIYTINQFDTVNEDAANIVVFFTDGQATSGNTNTNEILDIVENTISMNETEIFLFTFGIGDNVTRDLLTNLAVENNGFVTFLDNDEIEEVISNFYLTIRNPVLLNPVLSITPEDAISSIFPEPLPNLYKGQQLILAGRYTTPQDITFTLAGTAFNQPVEYTYEFNLSDINNPEYSFLPKLWAKKKIESLTIQYFSLPAGSDEAEIILDEIEETSICYQVLSTFTSLGGGTLDVEDFDENPKTSLSFAPNPFKDSTKATITLLHDSEIIVQIFTIDGKLIQEMRIDGIQGKNDIVWNGEDNNNNIIGNGLYFYNVTVSGKTVYSGKIIKI